ncbi:MAG: hypothetical protein R3246_08780 [Acidimicrobiia bacterium]|nr:hypothetical protein [Acidimicrobiia bacterium]
MTTRQVYGVPVPTALPGTVTHDDGAHWVIGDAEYVARVLLGGVDPHPALVADTVREVEYHGEPLDAREYACTGLGIHGRGCGEGRGVRHLTAGPVARWVEPVPVCHCGVRMRPTNW